MRQLLDRASSKKQGHIPNKGKRRIPRKEAYVPPTSPKRHMIWPVATQGSRQRVRTIRLDPVHAEVLRRDGE